MEGRLLLCLVLAVFCTQEVKADIVFLVDGSWSIGRPNFQQVRHFLSTLVSSFDVSPDHVRIGLAQYSDDSRTEFLLRTFQNNRDVLQYIARLPYKGGGTMTGKGLDFLLQEHFVEAAGSRASSGVTQIAVVITDGKSQDEVKSQAEKLKQRGIILYAIGIKNAILTQLKEIADEQNIYTVSDFSAPSQGTDRFLFVVSGSDSYLFFSAECAMATVADIVFLVDGSSSIGIDNFEEVRLFLREVVSGLDIGPDKVRVGLAQYSDEPYQEFLLKDHFDASSLLAAIERLPYRTGQTETGKAISFLLSQYFTEEAGSRARQRVPQIAVVITDGDSSDDVEEPAQQLREQGVIVFGIANETELIQIASHPPKEHVFIVKSFAELTPLKVKLQKVLCYNIIRQAVTVAGRSSAIKEGCLQTEEADIFFLIDHSRSIYPSDFKDMINFIIEFIQTFRIGPQYVRMGVVKYADLPELEFGLETYMDAENLETAVRTIQQRGGGTETGRALTFMGSLFDKAKDSRGHKVPEYLVVITDGKSSDEVKSPAEKLRSKGVTIYTIGVKEADKKELEEISGDPKRMFFVNDFDALNPIKDKVITDICSADGEVCKDLSGDLVFLIDSSGSIYPQDYEKMKDFMKFVISRSFIGRNEVHVGVLQFSSSPQPEFDLRSFFSKEDMLQAINGMQQLGGGTLTGDALTAVSQYFDSALGGRPHLQQRLVVVTDGQAQDEVRGPAEALREKGVKIYAIGVVDANTTQLLEISGSHDRMYSGRDFDALKDLESLLALQLCDPQRDCKKTERADIIFLVDGSTSISLENFKSMQKFMLSMVNQTTVGENLTRFGVLLYSNDPKMMFKLNQFKTRQEVLKAISGLKPPSGDTYTGKALKFCLQFFSAENGGRAELQVPQILMVITDGDATDRNNLVEPSEALRSKGVNIFSIGVKGANMTQLEIMAGQDKSKVFFVDNFAALEGLYKNISKELCNSTKPVCEKQQADLVFLVDQSGSIQTGDYDLMKNFTTELVKSFSIGQKLVRVGLAQFSSSFQHEFYLNQFSEDTEVSEHILEMTQTGGGTNIGLALKSIREYFETSRGSRRSEGISQNLVLITDGESQDDVEDPADDLRALGIEIFAIGIGDVHDLELLQITGTPQRLFTVQNFGSLENIKQKVLCVVMTDLRFSSTTACTIDIAMGFDISTRRVSGESLVSGHNKLQAFLPEIARYLSTVPRLCCTNSPVQSNLAYRVVNVDGRVLYDFNFEAHDEDVLRKVMALSLSESTSFNRAMLGSFREKFEAQSQAGVKVLLIFSDGLDDDIMKLEQESDLLRQSGVSALLVVALEGVRDTAQLQMVEFGRGFGYKLPLTIGMPSIGSTILKQIVSTSGVHSECFLCEQGGSGQKGYPGFPGEEGVAVSLGFPGPSGPPGLNVFERGFSRFLSRLDQQLPSGFAGPSECPAYPTELVFGLDMSDDVSAAAFETQRSALLDLLEGISIAESNCPSGARVAVVGFNQRSTRLIRFQDYHRKSQLIDAVKNVAPEKTKNKRFLGAAMRFVGQNLFKRVRAGVMVRKVAVFFSSGPTQDAKDVLTAVMEYRGLNIVPVVISLSDAPAVRAAVEVDDSGNSIFIHLENPEDLGSYLKRVKDCAICYDPCRPSVDCSFVRDQPQQVNVDLAVVVDGSREVQVDEFAGAQQLLGSVLEQLAVSPQPRRPGNLARVAVVQHGGAQAPTLEFGLQTFQNRDLMKRHLLQTMRQQGGPSLLGQTLNYTLREVLPKAGLTRRKRALLTVLATRTASADRSALRTLSLKAQCDGVAVFVLTVGRRYNQTQVEELASSPVQQHLVHLDRLGDEERGYAQRFFRVFLRSTNNRHHSEGGQTVFPGLITPLVKAKYVQHKRPSALVCLPSCWTGQVRKKKEKKKL
uniref:Collagen type VI alpha 6 chain n=1 Tax=Oryzias latipes TaxID=8090 RepID=H2MR52_ORYLA